MKWYVVHTFASHEFKIRDAILKGCVGTDLEDKIGEVLIPTQKTFQIKEGKKVERDKKLFNSYIIVQADLTPDVYNFIKRIPGVTHFLGTTNKPVPLSELEINRLLGINDRDQNDQATFEFLPGDMVKIAAGPFTDFEGIVDKVNPETKKIIVQVTVFGRVTPVELSIDQVEALT